MFLANPRVRQIGGVFLTLCLLIYGVSLIFGAHNGIVDRVLGVFVTACGAVSAVSGLLLWRQGAKKDADRTVDGTNRSRLPS